MAATACSHRQSDGEGLKRAGIVAGAFKSFDVHGPFPGLSAAFRVNLLASNACTFSKQVADAFAVANHFCDCHSSFAVAKIQFNTFWECFAGKILFLEDAFFVTFHRVGNADAHAHAVHAVMVSDFEQLNASPHVRNTQVGAVCLQAFVFHACHRACKRSGLDDGHLFTGNRALRAGNHFYFVMRVQVLSTNQTDILKCAFLIVAGRKKADFIHIKHIGGCAVDAVFFGILALRFF